MQTLTTIQALQDHLQGNTTANQRIALVPTMGNLHEGHLSLVKRARELADIVVVSIFVNPLQFGANEDLDTYPRTLADDKKKLEAAGVNCLFAPNVNEIYPDGQSTQTQVRVPIVTEFFCGKSRPGHFDGVSTIVCKLFNIVQPDIAVFGEKDFQQLAVIRKMAADLCIPVEIIGVATYRADDGLALSSRNQYLSVTERNIAPLLYSSLLDCKKAILDTPNNVAAITNKSRESLEIAGFKVDYFAACDAKTLAEPNSKTSEVAILVAASLGNTRLIDNVYFSLNHKTI